MGRPNKKLGEGAIVSCRANWLQPQAWVRPLFHSDEEYNKAIIKGLVVIRQEETVLVTRRKANHGLCMLNYVRMKWPEHPEIISLYAFPGQLKMIQPGPVEKWFIQPTRLRGRRRRYRPPANPATAGTPSGVHASTVRNRDSSDAFPMLQHRHNNGNRLDDDHDDYDDEEDGEDEEEEEMEEEESEDAEMGAMGLQQASHHNSSRNASKQSQPRHPGNSHRTSSHKNPNHSPSAAFAMEDLTPSVSEAAAITPAKSQPGRLA